ncbi:hypothetical protein QFC20_006462 [Naganishia adeliensis]|uniref:Uncharacterized protein n=1 Tax=Naganishia adeliensis TaxID=92952 RepID=A0ACC2VA38_9TREE|nr:hypothetical protein QFC20_006462 [Naganishia adeliensis]
MSVATQTQIAFETLKEAVLPVLPQVASSPAPLQSAGTLDGFAYINLTPSIGTEFVDYKRGGKPSLSIREVLDDPKKLRDLAILVSQRGVVFFRDATITPEEQKTLIEALGQAGGKPAGHGLHVHPLTAETSEFGKEISVISSEYTFAQKFGREKEPVYNKYSGRHEWIREFPAEGGGDTLWASGYELYDRLTPTYRKFLEGLTAEHRGDFFLAAAKAKGEPLRRHRGSPLNDNQDLKASHPVIRVNPVTGWKSLFVNSVFTKKINELNDEESQNVLKFLAEHVHGDFDREAGQARTGTRSVSVGEKPYFDGNALSRREAIAAGRPSGLRKE